MDYSARGPELSGCVHADTFDLIFPLDYYASWLWPVLCMIRERHVILKAALHSGLAL